MPQKPISRLFLGCPKQAGLTRYSVSTGDGDSITFDMHAGTGTRIIHSVTLTFHRTERGATMSVSNSTGFVRKNVSMASALRDLSAWVHLSIQDGVCFVAPEVRTRAFDTFKAACKGSWVEPLQHIRQTEVFERYCLPVELYLSILSTMAILNAGNSFLARPSAQMAS